MNGFMKSRRFRYGSAATAFTCAFIAVVVVFNVIFTALASKYLWYVDMTKEAIFSLSEATKDLMSDVTDEVNIYFASEPDELMEGKYSAHTRYIYQTALELAAEYDNVHVECRDVVKDRAFFEPFRTTAATKIQTTSVIVESGGESVVIAYEAFFIVDQDGQSIWAYNGEKTFMSAVLQVTSAEKPIVYFTVEHGESVGQAAPAITNLFFENGFDVQPLNLTKDEIDEDARIIIVNNPVYDFIGAEADDESANEIRKLDAFLDGFGCLMVFVSPENAGRLTNLSEFLEEWGIGFTPDTYVKDMDHSVSVDGLSLVAEYDSDTLGAVLYRDLTNNLSTMPKTVSRNTMPLKLLYEEGGDLSGYRDVSAVLTSYDTSVLMRDGEVQEKGSFPLLAISREKRIIDNEYYYSFVFVSGSADFANTNYIVSNAYANADILSATMSATGRDITLADIKYKVFDDTDLTITTAEANKWTVALVTVLPVAAAALGLVIFVRRKNA